MFGSLVTEPAAMTICALLLARQFYDLEPSLRLKLATIGLLFVNVSIGGTLTHFAAPPILMVARAWEWTTPYMFSHFGWRALAAVLASNALYYLLFRKELRSLADRAATPDLERPDDESVTALLPVPGWVTVVHMAFMAWTVFNSHYPALFISGFLFFLGREGDVPTRPRPNCDRHARRVLPRRAGDSAACRAGGLRRCWAAWPRNRCSWVPAC
jgi:Na+/H+ antiporter NhaD/arsenite permease-like protein